MHDQRDMRAEYGLGPPIDETQKRLDILIALQLEQVALLRRQAPPDPKPTTTVLDDGHPQTIELREPGQISTSVILDDGGNVIGQARSMTPGPTSTTALTIPPATPRTKPARTKKRAP